MQHLRCISIEIRDKLLVKPAFLRSERCHFLIIKRNAETLCHELADLLSGRTVLSCNRDNDTRMRRLQDRFRLRILLLIQIRLPEELPCHDKSDNRDNAVRHRIGQPEIRKPELREQVAERHKQEHRPDHSQHGTFEARADSLKQHRIGQRKCKRYEA